VHLFQNEEHLIKDQVHLFQNEVHLFKDQVHLDFCSFLLIFEQLLLKMASDTHPCLTQSHFYDVFVHGVVGGKLVDLS
jgi:hypothetical protein